VGGERPHVTVTVSLEALRDLEGSAELDHVGPVPVEVSRRLACDTSIRRVVLAGCSEPLDVGPTDLCNLILLCRRHHTMLHARRGFTLAIEEGRPMFRRPDGSMLHDGSERAPPLAV
jgi:hypothetical protein